jgi:hypothetical protein
MSDSTTTSMSTHAVVSFTLGVLAVIAAVILIPALKVLGLLLGVAAAIVGLTLGIRARSQGKSGMWMAWAGVGAGIYAAIHSLVVMLTL